MGTATTLSVASDVTKSVGEEATPHAIPCDLISPVVQKWIDGVPHAATARKARAVLNIALNEATRLGHIAVNPVARTTPPAHDPREGTAWTTDDVHRFLAAADADGYAPF